MSSSHDISNGKEKYPVPFSEYKNNKTAQVRWNFMSLQYVKTNVPGPGCDRELLLEQFVGCTCEGGQCTAETCSCLQSFGSAYEPSGRLKESFVLQQTSRPILECGNHCSCSRNGCNNRVVQKGSVAKFCIEYYSEKGLGLKIMEPLRRLSFVCEYAGEIVDRAEARKRLQESDSSGENNYLICLKEHTKDGNLCTFIDPKRIGNLGRFINHSCDPNLVMLPVRINHSIPRLALFSRRDLEPNEELTFDYSGCVTFSLGSAELSNTLQEDQKQTGGISTAVSKVVKRDSIPDKRGHSKLHGVSKSTNKTPLRRTRKQRLKLDSTVSTECADSLVEDGSRKSHHIKARKPCFCTSENCQQFLPLDLF